VTKNFKDDTFLFASNAVFIEELYEKYSKNPTLVSEEWRKYFNDNDSRHPSPSWQKRVFSIISEEKNTSTIPQNNTLDIIKTYGHLAANLDPIGLEKPRSFDDLGIDPNSELLELYAGNIGVEISHMQSKEEREWLEERYREYYYEEISKERKIKILDDLVRIEGFEQYLHKKFPGAKRFSVEGGETSVLSSSLAIEYAANFGVNEVVIGMAHRGRLGTLTKVLGKPYAAVLGEFMGVPSFPEDLEIASDVKYHMGYSNDLKLEEGKYVHVTLTPNPSHLEAVNPVVAGRVRAKQDLISDSLREKVMGLLIHGDAAFCGQGVVAESLMLSTLDAFDTGGIFHIVINNQVGFTASPEDGHKASRYSTDFAKIIGAPIFHVNGDDAEAVVKVTKLLSHYRAKFKKDVVLEIFCSRKYGHNEGDEPMYTQPIMYTALKDKKPVHEVYASKLISQNVIDQNSFNSIMDAFKKELDSEYETAKSYKPIAHFLEGIWKDHSRFETESDKKLSTGISKSKLTELLGSLCSVPASFNINSKLKKLFDSRLKDFELNKLDWATGEQLAFASLLQDGYPIRLIGQDAGRGTFSHRHSVLCDQVTGEHYLPLNNLANRKANYEVADSNLSEFAVMGYEFGYSMSSPKTLCIWEAQFGDFSNGAQIIFDQFLSTAETKWLRLSGLVLLLPHSYEGQGPEHTSARLERILQLCAEDNMQVAYPTTPASIFHFLRRQQMRSVRKPLIIMSPKSMLRNPLALSSLEDIAEGTRLKLVIADNLDAKKVRKVIICSGKLYYDLLEHRNNQNISDVAIIRVEQLYPFPVEELNAELKKYSRESEIIWCQEEPENMGTWSYFYSRITRNILRRSEIGLVSRKEAASPATGYAKVHKVEQEELIKKAFLKN
jgi:2-oxoglutarate dehydrogenase E1 component